MSADFSPFREEGVGEEVASNPPTQFMGEGLGDGGWRLVQESAAAPRLCSSVSLCETGFSASATG